MEQITKSDTIMKLPRLANGIYLTSVYKAPNGLRAIQEIRVLITALTGLRDYPSLSFYLQLRDTVEPPSV